MDKGKVDWVLKRKQGDPYSIPEPIAHPCDQMWIPVCKHIFDFSQIPPINTIEPYSIFFCKFEHYPRLSAGVVFCCKGHHHNQIILSIVIILAIDFKKNMSAGPKFTQYYDFVQEHSQIILPNVWLSFFTGFNPNWLRVALLQPGNHCPTSLHPWSRWVCLDINEEQYWTDTNNSTDTRSFEKLVHTFG